MDLDTARELRNQVRFLKDVPDFFSENLEEVEAKLDLNVEALQTADKNLYMSEHIVVASQFKCPKCNELIDVFDCYLCEDFWQSGHKGDPLCLEPELTEHVCAARLAYDLLKSLQVKVQKPQPEKAGAQLEPAEGIVIIEPEAPIN